MHSLGRGSCQGGRFGQIAWQQAASLPQQSQPAPGEFVCYLTFVIFKNRKVGENWKLTFALVAALRLPAAVHLSLAVEVHLKHWKILTCKRNVSFFNQKHLGLYLASWAPKGHKGLKVNYSNRPKWIKNWNDKIIICCVQRPSLGSNLCWGSTSWSLYSRLPEFKHIVGWCWQNQLGFRPKRTYFQMLQKVPIISEHYLSAAISAWIATARRWSLACWVWEGKRSSTHSNIQIQIYIQCKINLF